MTRKHNAEMLALALSLVVATTIVLAPPIHAQEAVRNYTVWSSVVLTRTGNRTPETLGEVPTKLTSVGANQAFAAGTYFRNRYIVKQNGTNGDDEAGAPLRGIDPNVYSNEEVFAMALDSQWNSATANAWFQGFYPAVTSSNASSDLSSLASNGTYVTGPLQGYQYAHVRTPKLFADPLSIYLDAAAGCNSFGVASYKSRSTQQANATRAEFDDFYEDIGSRFLGGVSLPSNWNYDHAYAIYDYLRYKYEHEAQAQRQLDMISEATGTSYITVLKELADQQLYAKYGDMTANNTATGGSGLPGGIPGSISTISGNYFAAQVVARLADAVYTDQYQPLNLFFGDLATFMSLFALTDLPSQSSKFYGMPNFGASAVFELWSHSNASVTTVPDPDNLYVRFLFRNGTEADEEMPAYSLFNRPKEEFDMPWLDFEQLMGGIRLSGTDNWCDICGVNGSEVAFCAAADEKKTKKHSSLSPVVAGVIGAVVTLAIAALLFGALMLLCGVRLHRNGSSRRRSDLGGFKGGQKMASDQDLTIPKGGATVGATIERHGHERTGSWELKQPDLGQDGDEWRSARPSMEQIRPVQPSERV